MKSFVRSAGLALLVICLSSCSLAFHRDWKKAAASPATRQPVDLTGAWTGTWKSTRSGHHGKLKAVVTLAEETKGAKVYDFRYHATWAKILSGGYTARHEVKPNGALTGAQDLGKLLGGVYHYEGKTSPTEFRAGYKCSLDEGVFEMKRPGAR